MAALLVALAVMGVMMSAILPAWRHQAKREKEAELIFRGEQYVRAISLWERKMGPGSRPPNFDMLVQQKFLRKKYKDPMTADGEFQPIVAGVQTAIPGAGRVGRGAAQAPPPNPGQPGLGAGGMQSAPGGVFGVVSKSTAQSIRLYNGRGRYNEWQFVHAGAANAPGGGGAGAPGLPGGGRGSALPGPTGRGGRRGGPGAGPETPGRGTNPGSGGSPGRGSGRGPGGN